MSTYKPTGIRLSRLAASPAQLQRFLDILTPLGFVPRRIEVSPDGSVTLHGDGAELMAERDVLAEWEAQRA